MKKKVVTAGGKQALLRVMDIESTLEQLAPALLRYGAVVSGDTQLGEDVAQEALASLVRRWQRHGPPESPRYYALCAARRIARRLRWRARLLDPLGSRDDTAGTQPSPDDVASWRQQLDRVRDALEGLPRNERRALLLVAVAELPTVEAARMLGVTQSAVKMRVHRARKHLEKTLRRNHETQRSALAAARVR